MGVGALRFSISWAPGALTSSSVRPRRTPPPRPPAPSRIRAPAATPLTAARRLQPVGRLLFQARRRSSNPRDRFMIYGGVVKAPKCLQKVLVLNTSRIKPNTNRLGMSCAARANLLVRGSKSPPSCVPTLHPSNSRNPLKGTLNRPEASTSKCCNRSHYSEGMPS